MKTQLLEDIDDSGAVVPAPGWGAAAPRAQPQGRSQIRPQIRPRPAVWRRAHDGPPGEPAAQPMAGGDGEPGPPPGAAFDAPRPAPAGEPEWLAELMREDAALAATRQASGRWKRRLLAWMAEAGALALLAGGGLWLYEARRVDGALVVVAQTAPVAARTAPGQPPARQAPVPAPASVVPVPAAASVTPMPPAAASSGLEHDAVIPATVAETPVPKRKPETKPERAKPQTTKPQTKPAAERGMSARQRREETLMQYRALGYDERQCVRRGCAMTRFGLACRG